MKVVSFGSLNYDLSIWLDRLPGPDETLRAQRMGVFSGGKGANQATAAARLGAAAHLVGCVGNDDRGRWLLDTLSGNGVNIGHVRISQEPTGTAVPLITPSEVSIVIVAGANADTGMADADEAEAVITGADVLLLQGEVGAAGAQRAAQIARSSGTAVLFNPAPVDPVLVKAVTPLADVLVMNRAEQAQVAAIGPRTDQCETVITLGSRGALINGVEVPPYPTQVVDPTGAGDAFCGALGVALAEGRPLIKAARFANAAGALAVATSGAQPSMPTLTAVESLLDAHREGV
ncbi:PfkB family carbohydrate kinase [Candidatus Poriferisocius sp.]|uniref:PfkB family carbohydrate kinase n=1 Tax=Candidatus Poriferisocius sp. TaxID=3101276 RepID=UPI003B023895